MPTGEKTLVLLVVVFSLVSIGFSAVGQEEGEVRVSTSLQLNGFGSAAGQGQVTWMLEGDQATLLRQKVLAMFDGHLTIPRDFRQGLNATGATAGTVGNGVIDEGEAQAFLSRVAAELVDLNPTFRHVRITEAKRADSARSLNRTSTGLVGANATTTGDIVFRFDVHVQGPPGDRAFRQADDSIAQAVHRVFDLDFADNLQNPAVCPPACVPFRATDGWHVVDSPVGVYSWPPGRFLWHGELSAIPWNDTSGVYLPNAYNNADYTTDGSSIAWLDLRFASSANLTVEYTGNVSADDELEFAIREAGTWSWDFLLANEDQDLHTALDPVPLDRLAKATFDLNAFVGKEMELRMRFADIDDGEEEGTGFFLRNFRINAPSRIEGRIVLSHTDVAVGGLAFSGVGGPGIGASLIRTPVGEVLLSDVALSTDDPPTAVARAFAFDVIESPQVLFVLLVASFWLHRRLQLRLLAEHRRRHPASDGGEVKPPTWLYWTNRLVPVLLLVLYLFPTILLGAGLFVGGGTLWILSLGSVFGLAALARLRYNDWRLRPAAQAAASETLIEAVLAVPRCTHCNVPLEDPDDVLTCACGATYQQEHGSVIGMCLRCGATLEGKGSPSPGSEATGFNYLIIADEPRVAFALFNEFVHQSVPGLCMSTMHPEKVRRMHGVDCVEQYWLSDSKRDATTFDPKRLDFEILRAIGNFLRAHPHGVVLLDGLEYLVVANEFEHTLMFVKKVSDLASEAGATLLATLTPSGLSEDEVGLLRKEFDRVEMPRKDVTTAA